MQSEWGTVRHSQIQSEWDIVRCSQLQSEWGTVRHNQTVRVRHSQIQSDPRIWKKPVWAVKKAPLEQWADRCERVALAVNKPFWRRSWCPVASTSFARGSTWDNASLILLLKPWNCLRRPTNAYRTTMCEWIEMKWNEMKWMDWNDTK